MRVSYSPFADPVREGAGFVYAYRAQTDLFAMMDPHATAEQVDIAWELIKTPDFPTNDLRVLADLIADQGPLRSDTRSYSSSTASIANSRTQPVRVIWRGL